MRGNGIPQKLGQGSTYGKMEIILKEVSWMMLDKEKEHINGRMEIPFQDYGEVINSMDK